MSRKAVDSHRGDVTEVLQQLPSRDVGDVTSGIDCRSGRNCEQHAAWLNGLSISDRQITVIMDLQSASSVIFTSRIS